MVQITVDGSSSDVIEAFRAAVTENRCQDVDEFLERNPNLVQRYPDIVLCAIDEAMVWKLLQLELPPALIFKCSTGTTCSGKSREAGTFLRNEVLVTS